MPKTLVLGANSMPGWHLYRYARARIIPACAPQVVKGACADWLRADILDAQGLGALFERVQPDQVVHCGGVCDVDRCESDPRWAMRINAESMDGLLPALPSETRLIYISSDHVFGGRQAPYLEDDAPDPISAYGRSRVEAERRLLSGRPDALVLRVALSIGPSVDGKTGHLDWLRTRSERCLPMTVFRDEFRSAVRGKDLARRILRLADSDVSGIRHAAAARAVSRVELAEALAAKHGLRAPLTPASRADESVPHLGRVELGTRFRGPLAEPLPSPV